MAHGFVALLHHEAHDGVHAVLYLVGLYHDVARTLQVLAVRHGLAVDGDEVAPLVSVVEAVAAGALLTELVKVQPHPLASLQQVGVLVLGAHLALAHLHGIHVRRACAALYETFCFEHIQHFVFSQNKHKVSAFLVYLAQRDCYQETME